MPRQLLPAQLSTAVEDPISPAVTFLLLVCEEGSAAGSQFLGASSADTAVDREDVVFNLETHNARLGPLTDL